MIQINGRFFKKLKTNCISYTVYGIRKTNKNKIKTRLQKSEEKFENFDK